MGSWTIQKFHGGLQVVAELARAVYKQDVMTDTQYLDWKFNKNPYGAFPATCESDGRTIGFVALIPLLVKIKNSTKLCAIGGDGMVHPDFRRLGILREMMGFILKEVGENLYIVYGTQSIHSPTARAITKYLHFIRVGNIRVLEKYYVPLSASRHLWVYDRLTPSNLLRFLGSICKLIYLSLYGSLVSLLNSIAGYSASAEKRGIYVREIQPLHFGPEFDKLWEEVGGSFKVAVVRTSRYLNWRYANPSATYIALRADEDRCLCGYCVLTYSIVGKGLKVAWVMDMLSRDPDVAAALIQRASDKAKQDGAHVLRMFYNKENRNIGRFGLGRAWWTSPLFVRFQNDEILGDTVRDISNWYLTVGDTEDWL
jgi:GNAT superfamily N-acetyltransferase/lipocalin